MSSWAYARFSSLIFGLGLALLGCSGSVPNGSGCVTGQSFPCSCASGIQGVQTCRADNAMGDCSCTQAFLVSGGGGGSPTQSGMPGSGGSGPAGTGGAMSPPMGGPAGTGGGAPGGGGTGGTMMPGNGGSGGGSRPPAGSPYAFCTMSTECGMNATCSTSTRGNGGITGYCSPSCGPLRPCAKPMSGNVGASCAATQCALGSCQNADCPNGMNCVQTRVLGQTVYSCEYPVR